MKKSMQFTEDELKIKYIWKTFLQIQKNILIIEEIWKIVGYIGSCNANSKLGWLHETGPWYLDMASSRHMINKKYLFIKKFQLNITKLECANREIFTFKEIGFICFFCMDKNKNPLNTLIDGVLYLLQACLNFISLN